MSFISKVYTLKIFHDVVCVAIKITESSVFGYVKTGGALIC